jgi:hypothetical protein
MNHHLVGQESICTKVKINIRDRDAENNERTLLPGA